MSEIAQPVEITEDDWIRPLVMVRNIAADLGVTLSPIQEQLICRGMVEGVTAAAHDTIARFGRAQAARLLSMEAAGEA